MLLPQGSMTLPSARSVDDYIAQLPLPTRKVVTQLRTLIKVRHPGDRTRQLSEPGSQAESSVSAFTCRERTITAGASRQR